MNPAMLALLAARVAAAPSLEFLSAAAIVHDGSTNPASLVGMTLGDAGDTLFLVIYGRSAVPAGVTVAGSPITVLSAGIGTSNFTFAKITSPGGVGNVVAPSGGAFYRFGAGIWRGPASATFSARTDVVGTTATVASPASGFVLAATYRNAGSLTPDFTGATERWGFVIPTLASSFGGADTPATGGGVTVSATNCDAITLASFEIGA